MQRQNFGVCNVFAFRQPYMINECNLSTSQVCTPNFYGQLLCTNILIKLNIVNIINLVLKGFGTGSDQALEGTKTHKGVSNMALCGQRKFRWQEHCSNTRTSSMYITDGWLLVHVD